MTAAEIVKARGGHWHGSYGMAFCPCHDDGRSPGLRISDDPRKSDGIDLHCFAGCDWRAIKAELRKHGLLSQFSDRSEKLSFRNDNWQRTHGAAQAAEDKAAIAAARGIWRKAQAISGTIGETYFRSRDIAVDLPTTVRFAPSIFHHPSGRVLPAVVAALSGPDRKITAVQTIAIAEDGHGKAAVDQPKITRGRMLSGAVRLAAAGPTLGIAEGVETALSAMQMHGVPVWAACGSRLDAIAIPDTVERLIIFGDNGEAGVTAAERAAIKHARQGLTIEINYPPSGSKDWNDELRAREVAA
jgi:hypothetical protein